MTKLEQAIAYFEDAIRESNEIIAEYSEEMQKELIKQKRHFEVALETMKKWNGEGGCNGVYAGRRLEEEIMKTGKVEGSEWLKNRDIQKYS